MYDLSSPLSGLLGILIGLIISTWTFAHSIEVDAKDGPPNLAALLTVLLIGWGNGLAAPCCRYVILSVPERGLDMMFRGVFLLP